MIDVLAYRLYTMWNYVFLIYNSSIFIMQKRAVKRRFHIGNMKLFVIVLVNSKSFYHCINKY